ncbi:MAG TPA: DUF1127 domain-containing protein [Pseudolabrys sp.]|nr:DUF1127 domain-containing protein [Pseudolabrys sp.]
MPTTIAKLMRREPRDAHGNDAYAQLAHDYPALVLIVDAGFAACSAIAHAWRLRRTRRILAGLDRDLLRDAGFTPEDLGNGRLDRVLKTQHAEARPGSWLRAWRRALEVDRSRKALAALGHDQLHALSEQGLKSRREALHDHSGCTCRTRGAHP